MRILFLSDLETRGGAAIAASRLAAGLSGIGLEVARLFAIQAGDAYYETASWKSIYAGFPRAIEVALNGVRRGFPAFAKNMGRSLAARLLRQEIRRQKFDVLHVHAIHNSAWDHSALAALDPDLPTVWTFHDHWSFSPESYLFRGADGVEHRLKPDGVDRGAAQAVRRRYFGSRHRLRLVANSRDTARCATECLRLPVETIPYGLPLERFAQIRKATAREALGLPAEGWVLGFSADSNADPVKGFDVLKEALEASGLEGHALAMGSAKPGEFKAGRVRVRTLGRVDNPLFQSLVYSACDLFVVPSRAEALGQVAMESIACGTPVVASRVGGLPDVVVPGQSGWLFEPVHPVPLSELLRRLERQRSEVSTLAAGCRHFAEARWSLERQARDYLPLYKGLLERD